MDNSQLTSLVSQYFRIDQTVIAGADDRFMVRFIGSLINSDSEHGFAQITNAVKPFGILAAIRPLDQQQELILFSDLEQRRKPNPSLYITMFVITLLSVLFTGGLYAFQGDLPQNIFQVILSLLRSGWPFAVSLLSILAAHEFGHYFAGKRHGIDVTLPLFIPFPFSTFGTMGAFISMRTIPKNKKQLFDLAIAGPLSGLVVSIIVIMIGMQLSELSNIPLASAEFIGLQMEGNSILYLLVKYLSFGILLPQPIDLSGLPLLLFWSRFFFTGMPFPYGALDVMLHPVAWAGWAGLFVTTINLIPAGQLDGGHIFHSVFGAKAMRYFYPIVIAALVIFGFFWAGWWTWAAILFLFGQRHAEPLDQVTKLDRKRRWLGALMILVFLITFIPVPITIAAP